MIKSTLKRKTKKDGPALTSHKHVQRHFYFLSCSFQFPEKLMPNIFRIGSFGMFRSMKTTSSSLPCPKEKEKRERERERKG